MAHHVCWYGKSNHVILVEFNSDEQQKLTSLTEDVAEMVQTVAGRVDVIVDAAELLDTQSEMTLTQLAAMRQPQIDSLVLVTTTQAQVEKPDLLSGQFSQAETVEEAHALLVRNASLMVVY